MWLVLQRYHALRCAALYFIICDLCIVDPMYQLLGKSQKLRTRNLLYYIVSIISLRRKEDCWSPFDKSTIRDQTDRNKWSMRFSLDWFIAMFNQSIRPEELMKYFLLSKLQHEILLININIEMSRNLWRNPVCICMTWRNRRTDSPGKLSQRNPRRNVSRSSSTPSFSHLAICSCCGFMLHS